MNLRYPHYYHVIYSVITFVQGLVPTEEEQVELVSMNSPLLDAVPPTDDVFFTDDQQQPGTDIIDRNFIILFPQLISVNSQISLIVDKSTLIYSLTVSKTVKFCIHVPCYDNIIQYPTEKHEIFLIY